MRRLSTLMISCMLLCASTGCSDEAAEPTPATQVNRTEGPGGGKGDTPNGEKYDGARACEAREKDMVFGSRNAFTPESVRWAAADVEGVNAVGQDDRGQEYTEYFVAVRKIDGKKQELLSDVEFQGLSADGSDIELVLDDAQIEWLEENDREQGVGTCVFTSWHGDMPALECEGDDSCPTLIGETKVSMELMRMRRGFNSNAAARDLIGQCANLAGGKADIGGGQSVRGTPAIVNGDPSNADDVLNRDFMRGCLRVDSMFQTGWRRSDSSVCAASMRLAECGCSIAGASDLAGIVSAILPTAGQQLESSQKKLSIRGFKLGSWSGMGSLPTGCEYIRTDSGDDLDTMVRCDLNATEVLDNQKDLKEYCRTKYSNDITVNVPIAKDAVQCTPPANDAYSPSCGAQPWIISYSSRGQ